MNYFNYFTEIEELFIRRRGRNLLLSPLDWALIEAWKQRGVPLHVALRAIETVFDGINKNTKSKSNIKSLMYCREEVETQYKDWLETQIGKSDAEMRRHADAPIESPKSEVQSPKSKEESAIHNSQSAIEDSNEVSLFFRKITESLKNIETRNGLGKAVSETLEVLEILEKQTASAPIDLEHLEKSLTGIEQNLDVFLIEHAEKSHLENIGKEIEKSLHPYKPRMADEIYRQTRQNLLLKRLREELNVPRISLFYL